MLGAAVNGPPNPSAPDGAGYPVRHAGLSNLRVLPNLLTKDGYQEEIYTCTLDEMLDFSRREPNLFSRERLSGANRYEFIARNGPNLRIIPRLETDGRATRWVEAARGGLAIAVTALEERADLEEGFELLVLAREAHYATEDARLRADAAAWDRCVYAVLLRPEFRLTPELIEQRLEGILGRSLANPNPLEPVQALAPTNETRGTAAPAAPRPQPAESAPPQPVPELTVPAAEAPDTPPDPPTLLVPATVPTPEVVGRPPELPGSEATAVVNDGLATVVARWAVLPDHVKSCILMLIDAADRLPPVKE